MLYEHNDTEKKMYIYTLSRFLFLIIVRLFCIEFISELLHFLHIVILVKSSQQLVSGSYLRSFIISKDKGSTVMSIRM